MGLPSAATRPGVYRWKPGEVRIPEPSSTVFLRPTAQAGLVTSQLLGGLCLGKCEAPKSLDEQSGLLWLCAWPPL